MSDPLRNYPTEEGRKNQKKKKKGPTLWDMDYSPARFSYSNRLSW